MKYMTVMRTLFFAILVIFNSCDMASKQFSGENVTYYRDFDIFYLRGIDTLKEVDKRQSVEVKYENGLPVFIKYYLPERTVTLILEDSFAVNDKPVYVYTTSNFHGGPPGRHKLYTSHHVEYKDFIHVNLSDSLICETKDVPPTRNFRFDLYVKEKESGITETSKGEIDYDGENAKLSRQQLYLKWLGLLREKRKKDTTAPIMINKLPPE
jgi:hypothetical protein